MLLQKQPNGGTEYETRDYEIRIRRTSLCHALKRLTGTQPGGRHPDGHVKPAHGGKIGRCTDDSGGTPLPARKQEKPSEDNVRAVSEHVAATSASWQKKPSEQVASIEVGFVIQAPEPPTYTPEPEPMGMSQEEPMPTVPVDPIVPAPDPAPQPTEPPAGPAPAQPAEQPSTGYALCTCGATLSPEELLPHMKAHAINAESHSYSAW